MQHPRRYVIPIPYELATDNRLEPRDVHTWMIIAALANDGSLATDQREFISPGHETMARLCNCTINTLRISYSRLRDAGWITALESEEGKPLRIGIIVPRAEVMYRDVPMQVRVSSPPDSLHNIQTPAAANLSQSDPPPQKLPDAVPTFPPDLVKLADSIYLFDLDGHPYPLPSLLSLWTYSGHAPFGDIRQGLRVMERYQSRRQPVTAPTGLWRSLFSEGRFLVKKMTIADRSMKPGKDIPDSLIREQMAAARDLSRGQTIEIGKLHKHLRAALLEKDALDIRGVHCELKPMFTLTFDLSEYKFQIAVVTPSGEEDVIPHNHENA